MSDAKFFAFIVAMSERLQDNSGKTPLSKQKLIEGALRNLSSGDYIDAANYCFLLGVK